MKYASAIRFGGELVSPEECDYDSYKHLGLLCPECKDPVFLRAGGERARGETVYQVGAHFSHFAAKDPVLAAKCEKRVSQYNLQDLQRKAAIARNQRLRWLQSWFWKIILAAPKYWNFENLLSEARESESEGLEARAEVAVGILKANVEVLRRSVKDCVEEVWGIDWNSRENEFSIDADVWSRYIIGLTRLTSKADRRLHEAITLEVIDFLFTPRMRPSLKELCFFWLFIAAGKEEFRKPGVGKDIAVWLIFQVARTLVEINWAAEFDRIRQQESKAA